METQEVPENLELSSLHWMTPAPPLADGNLVLMSEPVTKVLISVILTLNEPGTMWNM